MCQCMSGSAGRGGHAVYSFSLCHPLIFFHPFLRSLPAPARAQWVILAGPPAALI